MSMNKTVLAVAIAGIAASPMMASATTTISGAVALQLSGSDVETEYFNENNEGDNEVGDARLVVNEVIVGVSASQAMNSGLTGYGSLRLDLESFSNGKSANDGTDADRTGNVTSPDNVYVGIRGGFGDIRIGETGNPGEYGQISDILDDAGIDINQGIGYTGSFGGATLGLAWSPSTNEDVVSAGVKFAWNGLALGLGVQNLDELTNATFSVGFSYAGASVALGGSTQEADEGGEDETGVHAKVGYSIAGVSLGLTFESLDIADQDKVRFDAGYSLGGGMNVSTRINSTSNPDGVEDVTDWRFVLAKSF